MRYVLALLDPNDRGLPEDLLRQYEALPRRRDYVFAWRRFDHAAVLTAWDDPWGEPLVAEQGGWVGIGVARLDNRAEVERWLGEKYGPAGSLTDLELVVRCVAHRGSKRIRDLLGDFGFMAWHGTTRTAIAATDALGVKKFYYARQQGRLALATRAEALATHGHYDLHTLVALTATCQLAPDRTAFANVSRVPLGSSITFDGEAARADTYWSFLDFAPNRKAGAIEDEAAQFRHLMAEAVSCRVDGAGGTWAQLSGGLDSSSVVSLAQWLVSEGELQTGVEGIVSWLYRWSVDGDEREYSDAVLRKYPMPKAMVLESWFWEDDGQAPPPTDEPAGDYAFYARERRTASMVRKAGGRTLLTGFGSDHYLLGNMFFFADQLAHGRIRALSTAAKYSALGRVSFWSLMYQNAVLPLLPRALQHRLVPGAKPPCWIIPSTIRRLGLRANVVFEGYAGRIGSKYAGLVREMMRGLPQTLNRHEVLEHSLDVRHPFLYRPLVEHGLQLPAELCVQPHARKWILRQAMKDILPEEVRSRVGKGSNPGCTQQSLVHERPRLEIVLKNPVLAQLGCIDGAKLKAAYSAACEYKAREELIGNVVATLAVETWLQARSGRWPTGDVTKAHS